MPHAVRQGMQSPSTCKHDFADHALAIAVEHATQRKKPARTSTAELKSCQKFIAYSLRSGQ
jgi:hypothetical protein